MSMIALKSFTTCTANLYIVTMLRENSDDVVTILWLTCDTSHRLQNYVALLPWFLNSDCVLLSGVWEFLFSADFLVFEDFLVPKFQLFLLFSAYFWQFYPISHCFPSFPPFFVCGLSHLCIMYCSWCPCTMRLSTWCFIAQFSLQLQGSRYPVSCVGCSHCLGD